jgi:hypothetical protein
MNHDNTCTEISWRTCVTGKDKTPKSLFNSALRQCISYQIQDFRINFNNANLSFTDSISSVSTNIVCENYGDNIKFVLSSLSSVFLGWKLYVVRTNNFSGNTETSTDFVFTGQLLSNTIGELYTKQIGIKFTLNIQNDQFQAIKNQISGWSYVRVRRDINNSTRLGTGYVHSLLYVFDDLFAGCYTLTPFERSTPLTELDNEWLFQNETRNRLQVFYSPNFLTKKAGSFIPGDYMRMIGRTNDFGFLNQYSQRIF